MGRRHPGIEAALAALKEAGIQGEVEHTNGGHLRVRWQWNGQDRVIIVSNTPRCSHATMNVRADVRRALRRDGLSC